MVVCLSYIGLCSGKDGVKTWQRQLTVALRGQPSIIFGACCVLRMMPRPALAVCSETTNSRSSCLCFEEMPWPASAVWGDAMICCCSCLCLELMPNLPQLFGDNTTTYWCLEVMPWPTTVAASVRGKCHNLLQQLPLSGDDAQTDTALCLEMMPLPTVGIWW